MLKALLLKLEHWLPFLQLNAWPGDPSQTGALANPAPPSEWQAGGDYYGSDARKASRNDASLQEIQLSAALLDDLVLSQSDLSRARISTCRLQACRLERVQLAQATLSAVDLEAALLQRVDLHDSRLVGVSLRESRLEDCDLSQAQLHLCDLFSSQWQRINASHTVFSVVDFSFAVLGGVDFSGADLRGCRFVQTQFHDVNLDGAKVAGANFRGARGLTPAQRLSLRAGGARLGDPWLQAFFMRRLTPKAQEGTETTLAPELMAQKEQQARMWSLGIQTLLYLSVAVWCALNFWQGPHAPDSHGFPDVVDNAVQGQPSRDPTAEEVAKTRENLEKLRAALKAAYDTSARYGVARYPTMEELSNNEFDRDGNGPGTDKLPLMAGGVPGNFLTGGEGVSPYCNNTPSQGTLTGDDIDWHYCEETGRVYACGGYTTAPTLGW